MRQKGGQKLGQEKNASGESEPARIYTCANPCQVGDLRQIDRSSDFTSTRVKSGVGHTRQTRWKRGILMGRGGAIEFFGNSNGLLIEIDGNLEMVSRLRDGKGSAALG